VYVPSRFGADEATLHRLLANPGAADLVTVTPAGMLATLLPVLYEPEGGERGSIVGHVARANPQWSALPLAEALVILHGPDTYVSPSWYPSKAEHGRVVPTWDYLAAHVYGRLVVHDDPVWLDALVRKLTDHHERDATAPWAVGDAPPAFIASQLRAIVGVEVIVSRFEVAAKWSQNRPPDDVEGVINGLETAGSYAAADEVRRARA